MDLTLAFDNIQGREIYCTTRFVYVTDAVSQCLWFLEFFAGIVSSKGCYDTFTSGRRVSITSVAVSEAAQKTGGDSHRPILETVRYHYLNVLNVDNFVFSRNHTAEATCTCVANRQPTEVIFNINFSESEQLRFFIVVCQCGYESLNALYQLYHSPF